MGEAPIAWMPSAMRGSWRVCRVRPGARPDFSAQLLLSLPAETLPEERLTLLTEFNAGRNHLLFYLELKLHHWAQPPWLLYKMAHHNDVLAIEAFQQCVSSNDPHVLVKALKEEPLRTEGLQWLDGQSLGDAGMEHLTLFVAKLKFAPTAERIIEAPPNEWPWFEHKTQ